MRAENSPSLKRSVRQPTELKRAEIKTAQIPTTPTFLLQRLWPKEEKVLFPASHLTGEGFSLYGAPTIFYSSSDPAAATSDSE